MIELTENDIKTASEYTAAFSGPRARKLPKSAEDIEIIRERLYFAIAELCQSRYVTYISGMCNGFDLMAASQVIRAKRVYPRIKLIGALPFKGSEGDFDVMWQAAFRDILSMCDEIVTLAPSYYRGCYSARNKYMVERSSYLLCHYDGFSLGGTYQTIQLAKKYGLTIRNLYDEYNGGIALSQPRTGYALKSRRYMVKAGSARLSGFGRHNSPLDKFPLL